MHILVSIATPSVFTYGRLLVYITLTHEQSTWFGKCVGVLHFDLFMLHVLYEACV